MRIRGRGHLNWGVVLLGVFWLGSAARAETLVTIYSGKSFTSDADLRLRQPGQHTDVRYQGVSYEDQSFTSPIYYGIRVTHFLKKKPWLGAAVEFFHYKVYAQADRTVHAIGTDQGGPVDSDQRLGDSVQRFSISHGVNYLTLHFIGRLRWQRDTQYPAGRLQPYGGIGGGGLLLHPESRIRGASLQHYEWNGLGYVLFAGVNYLVTERWGLFVEYKFNDRNVNVAVDGGSGETRLNTHHIAFGTSYRL